MVQKKSNTFFIDLIKEEYFGEIEFFTDEPWKISARSRDFTECYIINKKDFISIVEDYIAAIVTYFLSFYLVYDKFWIYDYL